MVQHVYSRIQLFLGNATITLGGKVVHFSASIKGSGGGSASVKVSGGGKGHAKGTARFRKDYFYSLFMQSK